METFEHIQNLVHEEGEGGGGMGHYTFLYWIAAGLLLDFGVCYQAEFCLSQHLDIAGYGNTPYLAAGRASMTCGGGSMFSKHSKVIATK